MLLVSRLRLANKWWTAEALQPTIEVETLAYDFSSLRQAHIAFSVRRNVPREKLRVQGGEAG